MASNKELTTGVKGDTTIGALWSHPNFLGDAADLLNADVEDMIFNGWTRMSFASSTEGVSSAISADTEEIKAWGEDVIYVEETNFTDTLTINFLPHTDADVYKLWFGNDSVTAVEGGFQVGVGPTPTEEVSIAIIGKTRFGKRAVLFARRASVERNIDLAWNDSTPSAVPVSFKCLSSTLDGNKTHLKLFGIDGLVPEESSSSAEESSA